jgi:FtsP/CotA-like multicopper oxidase with cupredoxin domain
MKPGEVQMWRIVNTSGRAGSFFVGPPPGFQWKQLAQDGVQFKDVNYQSHVNNSFLLAPGNRADLLVKAPAAPCANPQGCTYPVMVQNEVDQSDLLTAAKITLMSVNVSGTPLDPTSKNANFIPTAPDQPKFLDDITSDMVEGTKTIVFASTGPGGLPTPAMHTIDGKKFDGEVGEVVLLNNVEEWKIVNRTWANSAAPISHPFHIHINPFQIVEVFAPFEILTDKNGNALIQKSNKTGKVILDPTNNNQPLPAHKYVFVKDYYNPTKYPGQCYLDPLGNPDSWKPCAPPQPGPRIWWDTFPIPTGVGVLDSNFKPVLDKNGNPVQVPGYFKMRSRFVDFTGYYVIHCHILAHEDRGMMTVVEVAPAKSPYVHQ